jgi:hypothetical protein
MNRTTVIPQHLQTQLSAWFKESSLEAVEDMAVVLGVRTSDADVATSVLRPGLQRAPGWYEQKMNQSWHDLYDFAFANQLDFLMQVHSHPGEWTGHSRRDDLGAVSDQRGFLSVVIADFGMAGVEFEPPTSIHERTPTGWRTWSKDEVARRLKIVPTFQDLRRGSNG